MRFITIKITREAIPTHQHACSEQALTAQTHGFLLQHNHVESRSKIAITAKASAKAAAAAAATEVKCESSRGRFKHEEQSKEENAVAAIDEQGQPSCLPSAHSEQTQARPGGEPEVSLPGDLPGPPSQRLFRVRSRCHVREEPLHARALQQRTG